MKFFVFSYNRGKFLSHCVDSIERCAPNSEIVVVDDRSSDPATLKALQQIGRRHQIMVGSRDGTHKHGGLYYNMQAALDSISGNRPVCFLQDDMQVIRDITEDDIADIEGYFARDPHAAFLHPAFFKGCRSKADQGTICYDEAAKAYFRKPEKSKERLHYADIFIGHPKRLRESNWRFLAGEPANDEQAKTLFSQKGLMFAPFAMWLPFSPAYRGRRKTLALQLAESLRGCGFYPFEAMDAQATVRFKLRDPDVLPVAEAFLKNSNRALKARWIYHPLQGSKALRLLNRLELSLIGRPK